MSGRIPSDFIQDLVTRIDIVDLIDARVQLKRSGSNYVARCPFHTEKTPSFTVNRSKQFYHCFGCGASGNVIQFLMDYDHLNFVETVEDLASSLGLSIPREEGAEPKRDVQKKQSLEQQYGVQIQVAQFYAKQLKLSGGNVAVDYLKSREITGEIARDFLLGYASPNWSQLTPQFDNKMLLQTGLVIEKNNNQHYDRFRGRIMFPIRDKRGRCIGFGGRVLDDSLPKYLNSPETATFHKNQEVYGLFELLKKQPKPEQVLVVEGYMDVIALAQQGIPYAVATLGTAISPGHIHLLFRFTQQLIICFDGDEAGKKAAWRALEAALSDLRDGRQIRFMQLPDEHDPDSLVRQVGKAGFEQVMLAALPLSDYFFSHIMGPQPLVDMESRASVVNHAKPLIDKLPNGMFRDMMLEKLKEVAQLQKVEIEPAKALKANRINNKFKGRVKSSAFRIATALLIQNPTLVEKIDSSLIADLNETSSGVKMLTSLVNCIEQNPSITTGGLVEFFREQAEAKTVVALANLSLIIPEEGIEAEFNGSLERLLEQARKFERAELIAKANSGDLTLVEQNKLKDLLSVSKSETENDDK